METRDGVLNGSQLTEEHFTPSKCDDPKEIAIPSTFKLQPIAKSTFSNKFKRHKTLKLKYPRKSIEFKKPSTPLLSNSPKTERPGFTATDKYIKRNISSVREQSSRISVVYKNMKMKKKKMRESSLLLRHSS